jgi:putative transposase
MITDRVLRFVFLLISRVASWLRLSRREEPWQTAEILILRHQLAVLQRRPPRRPDVTWADRALLAALLSVIAKARRQDCGSWSLRTRSCAGTVTSSTAAGPPGPRAARPAGRDPPEHQRPGPPAGPREPRMRVPQVHGELAGRGVKVAASTVWEILRKAGIDPAPRRSGPTWPQFLRSQAEAILACDFFTADLFDGTRPTFWP